MSNPRRTLVGLALLRANFAETGGSYADFFLPIIEDCIPSTMGQLVIAADVSKEVASRYGFVLPIHVAERFIHRLAKKRRSRATPAIARYGGEFFVAATRSTPSHSPTDSTTEHEDLARSLAGYLEAEFGLTVDEATAEQLLVDYLAQYSIDCIASFHGRSALPRPQLTRRRESEYYVGSYAAHARVADEESFLRLVRLVEGNLLLNALRCEDLGRVEASYKNVDFYLDTPLILRLVGLDPGDSSEAAHELVRLVKETGGRFHVFRHTLDETVAVIRAGADSYHAHAPSRMRVVTAAKLLDLGADGLLLEASRLPGRLDSLGIEVVAAPTVDNDHSLDEAKLEKAIEDEVRYLGPSALRYDTRSIQAIAQLRRSTTSPHLEDCGAVLVTSNRKLATVARKFSLSEELIPHVGPVITDLTLANHAWLKRPLESTQLPTLDIMARCAAAVAVPTETWRQFVNIAEKMKAAGEVDPGLLTAFRLDLEAEALLSDKSQGGLLTLDRNAVADVLQIYKSSVTHAAEEKASRTIATMQERHKRVKLRLEAERERRRSRNRQIRRMARKWGRSAEGLVRWLTGLAFVGIGLFQHLRGSEGLGVGLTASGVVWLLWLIVSIFLPALEVGPAWIAKTCGARVENLILWARHGSD